jgi:hypothetical protein
MYPNSLGFGSGAGAAAAISLCVSTQKSSNIYTTTHKKQFCSLFSFFLIKE